MQSDSNLRERLGSADVRFLAICLAVFALTAWFSVRYFYRAFPQASIDFRVNREQSQDLARRFLESRGFVVSSYQQASRFQYDDEAKTFLEREVGLEKANQLMSSKIRLWRWSNRWFRPLQAEEFTVDITPQGQLAGFAHLIPEAAPRTSVTQQQARELAEQFLRDTVGADLGSLEFVEASSTVRQARTDHSFTWQERDFAVHDARYRLGVTVLGNEIGGFREYLKVPETWVRSYQSLRSRNQAAEVVDTVLLVLLAVGLLAVLVISIRRHNVRRRQALIVASIGAVLFFLSSWNAFPLTKYGYPTTDSYKSFLTQAFLQSLLGALGVGLLLTLLTAAAEPLYREFFGSQVSLGNLFTFRGLHTKSFLRGSVLGITLTGIFVAYQIAFYMVAYKFGAWSPADVPYDNLLNTRFPWLFVLFSGFFPAVSEEFLFRMFAIPFFKKLVRVTWLALVLAGFIWGFGHAGYPQQPFWIRGVEVGIAGVILGLVMLRWGILPTLVWHYSTDAMYAALLLLRSQSLYFRLSGLASAGIVVLPAAFALFEYGRRGGFDPEVGLTNGEDSTATPPPILVPVEAASATTISSVPLTYRARVIAVCVLLCAAAVAFVPVQRLGNSPHYRLPEGEIRASAGRFLNQLGLKADRYRVIAFPDEHWSGLAGIYMLKHVSLADVASMYQRYRPIHQWAVRYYRPLQQDEVDVSADPETGTVLDFNQDLAEDQPGADLPEAKARELAAAFASARGIDTAAMDLKESNSQKRKARRDYTLVWEARPGDPRNVDEAHYRVEVGVSGDGVTSIESFWKVPETFERARTKQNFISIASLILGIVLIATLGFFGIRLLVDATRERSLPWARAIRYGLLLAGLGFAGSLMNLSQIYRGYDTAVPLRTFQMTAYAGIFMGTILQALFGCALFAVLFCLKPDFPEWFAKRNRRAVALDALLLTATAAALAAALYNFNAILMAAFPAFALPQITSPQLIVSAFPALSAVAGAATSTVKVLIVLALVSHIVLTVRSRQRWWVIALVLIALAGMLPGGVHTIGEFLLAYSERLVQASVIVAMCVFLLRNNLLAYGLAVWTITLGSAAAELFAQQNTRLQLQGWIVIGILLLTVTWAIAPAFSRPQGRTGLERAETPA